MENDIVIQAMEYAERMHSGQTRSNGDPYFSHPQRVLATLERHGVTDPVIKAATSLHDVPEDCSKNEEEVEENLRIIGLKFGKEVEDTVRQLTNYIPPGTPFAEKQAKLIEHAKYMSDRSKWIKLADRLDNLSGMETWDSFRKVRYAKAGLELVRALFPFPPDSENLAVEVIKAAENIIKNENGVI